MTLARDKELELTMNVHLLGDQSDTAYGGENSHNSSPRNVIPYSPPAMRLPPENNDLSSSPIIESYNIDVYSHLVDNNKDSINYSSTLRKIEIFELTVQSAVMFVLQSMAAYYTCRALPYIHDKDVFIYSLAGTYSLIASAYSIRTLYQLGPYETHMYNLEKDINAIDKIYKQLKTSQAAMVHYIDNYEEIVREIIFKKHLSINYRFSSLKRKISKNKRSCGSLSKDILYFSIGLMTGFSTGVNFNSLISVASNNLQEFLPVPIIVALTNAVIDMMINRFVHGKRSVIASHLMISRAFDLTKSTRRELNEVKKNMDAEIKRLNDLGKMLNLELKVNEIKIDDHSHETMFAVEGGPATLNLINFKTDSLEVKSPGGCRYVALSLGSMVPFLLSNLCAPFAAGVAAKEDDTQSSFFIILLACMLEIVLNMGWRAYRFHAISGGKALENFGHFSNKNYNKMIKRTCEQLDTDVERTDRLEANVNSIEAILMERKARESYYKLQPKPTRH